MVNSASVFIERNVGMGFHRKSVLIKWLVVAATILAMVDGVVSELGMVKLDCRYDMMTGGRMCDCEYRDKVMSENTYMKKNYRRECALHNLHVH